MVSAVIVILVLVNARRRTIPEAIPETFAKTSILLLCRSFSEDLTKWVENARISLEPHGYQIWAVSNEPLTVPHAAWFHISDDEARAKNATNFTSSCGVPITAWDKGFLVGESLGMAQTWFLEDDVFVPRYSLFLQADAAHPEADLLIDKSSDYVKDAESLTEWCQWETIHRRPDGTYPLPFPWIGYGCKAPVLRASAALLGEVRKHLDKGEAPSNHHEYVFATLAQAAGLRIDEDPTLFDLDCHDSEERIKADWLTSNNRFSHSIKSAEKRESLRALL